MTKLTFTRKQEVVEILDREVAIVQMIANEKTREEIGDELELSFRTIESEVVRIKKKFLCKTMGGLVALFFRNNLIK